MAHALRIGRSILILKKNLIAHEILYTTSLPVLDMQHYRSKSVAGELDSTVHLSSRRVALRPAALERRRAAHRRFQISRCRGNESRCWEYYRRLRIEIFPFSIHGWH